MPNNFSSRQLKWGNCRPKYVGKHRPVASKDKVVIATPLFSGSGNKQTPICRPPSMPPVDSVIIGWKDLTDIIDRHIRTMFQLGLLRFPGTERSTF